MYKTYLLLILLLLLLCNTILLQSIYILWTTAFTRRWSSPASLSPDKGTNLLKVSWLTAKVKSREEHACFALDACAQTQNSLLVSLDLQVSELPNITNKSPTSCDKEKKQKAGELSKHDILCAFPPPSEIVVIFSCTPSSHQLTLSLPAPGKSATRSDFTWRSPALT